jgi:hypothetical protein
MRLIGPAVNLAEVMGVSSRTHASRPSAAAERASDARRGVALRAPLVDQAEDRLATRKDLLRFLLKLSRSPEFFTEQARREKVERSLADRAFALTEGPSGGDPAGAAI